MGMADIAGTSGNDTLIGTDQSDRIDGREGNDIIDGRGGDDVLIGGAGDDIFYVDSSGDVVLEGAGEGSDSIYTSVSYTLGAGSRVELLSAFSTGWTIDMNLTGNEFDNAIVGTQGANILYGGSGGADVLVGLGGNDTYIVDSNDIVYEDANAGSDTVYAVSNYTLGALSHIHLSSANSTATTG
jgi:Ca2+-binding RTX toxin-like protein